MSDLENQYGYEEQDPGAVQDTGYAVPAASAGDPPIPAEVESALQQMRTQICGLGLGCILVSIGLSIFIITQNLSLGRGTKLRTKQIAAITDSLEVLKPALDDLAAYSSANPELLAIFARHGLQIDQQANKPQ